MVCTWEGQINCLVLVMFQKPDPRNEGTLSEACWMCAFLGESEGKVWPGQPNDGTD